MEAIKFDSYGAQTNFYWTNVPTPQPAKGQLLVSVKAVSINPVDWKIRKGEMILFMNKKFPKGLGVDFAGVVETVGEGVSEFKKGDEVFGWLPYDLAGSVAEFVVADATLTVKKPANISFVEASTLPMACIASITALIDNANLTEGTSVLINGCTGGVGQFASMIAKASGARVSGTCNAASMAIAKEIGVDVVIDYAKTNVLEGSKKYDVIFDTVGNLTLSKSKAIMTDRSIFLELNPTLPNMFFGSILNLFCSKKVKTVLAKASSDKMLMIANWSSKGLLKPIIGGKYDFKDALTAYQNMENGEKNIGKTVIINL
jgi:NADPH:quinone reductase-like Zn-dependent oxidoreductase